MFLTLAVVAQAATATFVGADHTTQAGIFAHGTQGELVPFLDDDILGNLWTVSVTGSTGAPVLEYLWNWQTSDPRSIFVRDMSQPYALNLGLPPIYVSSNGGIASCWYDTSDFYIDTAITDGSAHQISLYVVDWDYLGRSERIDVIDAVTDAVLSSYTVSNFTTGTYLNWNVSGEVVFHVVNRGWPNAVASAVFIDQISRQ
jgi:hypothetical protein